MEDEKERNFEEKNQFDNFENTKVQNEINDLKQQNYNSCNIMNKYSNQTHFEFPIIDSYFFRSSISLR